MRKFNYKEIDASVPIFEQKQDEITLAWDNYQNNKYEVVVDEINHVEQGENFKELLARGFAIENLRVADHMRYGIGKKLQPKTKDISEMKETIENANKKLQEIKEKQQEKLKEVLEAQEPKTQEPINEAQGGTND